MVIPTTGPLALSPFVVWWITSHNTQIQDLAEDALIG